MNDVVAQNRQQGKCFVRNGDFLAGASFMRGFGPRLRRIACALKQKAETHAFSALPARRKYVAG
jgi:hypothetical protein